MPDTTVTTDEHGQTTVRPNDVPPADVPRRPNPKPSDAPVEIDPEPNLFGVPLREYERTSIQDMIDRLAECESTAGVSLHAVDARLCAEYLMRLLDAYEVVADELARREGENRELLSKMIRDPEGRENRPDDDNDLGERPAVNTYLAEAQKLAHREDMLIRHYRALFAIHHGQYPVEVQELFDMQGF